MVTTLLHVPTGGLRTEINAEEEGDHGDESRTKLKPPSNPPNPVKDQIGAETEEDTEGDPHLPTHDEAASNQSRGSFCSENRDGSCFRADTNAE